MIKIPTANRLDKVEAIWCWSTGCFSLAWFVFENKSKKAVLSQENRAMSLEISTRIEAYSASTDWQIDG